MNEKPPQNSKLSLLKKQIESGIFPHAYLFSGNDIKSKKDAIEFLVSHFFGERGEKNINYLKIDNNPITIDEIRELKTKASQSPLGGEKNVFLINNIENLSRDAAPALLKLLEDPVESCIIIATTDNAAALLNTIKSRFSIFRFQTNKPEARAGEDEFKTKLFETLIQARASFRKTYLPNNILKMEKLLEIYKVMNDPTINKRLLGEYLNMIQ